VGPGRPWRTLLASSTRFALYTRLTPFTFRSGLAFLSLRSWRALFAFWSLRALLALHNGAHEVITALEAALEARRQRIVISQSSVSSVHKQRSVCRHPHPDR